VADLQDLKLIVARVIWSAMVNDETPDDETLWREGYLDAAEAAIKTVREADKP